MKKVQSGLGIASLVIGIISLLISCTGLGVIGIIGLILSIIGFAQKDRAKGMCIAGIITSSLAFLLSLFMIMSGISLFSDNSGNEMEKSKNDENSRDISENEEYLEESDIGKIYSDADLYKGKFVKIIARVFDVEKDEENIYLQAFQDVENSDRNTLVMYSDAELNVLEDDYVEIDGEILGKSEGENAFGGIVSAPMINAKSVKKLSYIDAVVPTIKEIEIGEMQESNGYKMTLEKVEFAEKQTRFYLKFKNEGNAQFSLNCYSSKVKQGDKQFEVETDYNADYEELKDEVMTGVETSGILTFGEMNPNEQLNIYIDGYDNENYENISFEFKVPN